MLGYGMDLQTARKLAYFNLGQFTANTTVTAQARFGVPPGVGGVRILGIHVLTDAIPADPDGTMLLKALVNDVSEGADDTVLTGQDLEATCAAANRWYECTLDSESSEKELSLDAGDSVRFQLINNSAGIGTNANVHVCVEFVLLPRLGSDETQVPAYVGYRSQF